MSNLSSANVTDINIVLKERTHMRLCINMLIFTHNLGNWLMMAGSLSVQFTRTVLVELSSGPAAQFRHHLRTVQTTAEVTPFFGKHELGAL